MSSSRSCKCTFSIFLRGSPKYCDEPLALLIKLVIRKTALQNHKLSSDRFFSVESDGEGPTSKFEREEGQTDREKMAREGL